MVSFVSSVNLLYSVMLQKLNITHKNLLLKICWKGHDIVMENDPWVWLHCCCYGCVSYWFEHMQYPWVPCSDIQIEKVDINKANKVLWRCSLSLISITSCCLSVWVIDDGLNPTEKLINLLGVAHFYFFDIFRSKSIKLMDNHKNLTDHFPSIFDINQPIVIDFDQLLSILIKYRKYWFVTSWFITLWCWLKTMSLKIKLT